MSSPLPVSVRPERPDDAARIHAVQTAAFGQVDEADMVDALRAAATPTLSLVAESDGSVVGHILFSPVTIEGCPEAPAVAGLAPIGVDPAHQARGVGSALMRAGLRACAQHDWRAVFLLGDPGFYARYGFELAAPRGFHYESDRFDTGFQLLELEPGALSGCAGWVRYHEAFAGL